MSRACKLTSLPHKMHYYKSQKDDTAVIQALQDLSFKLPTYVFRKLFAYIRRSGNVWNHKKVYRVYKLLKLNRKRKGKRRLPRRVKQLLVKTELLNQSWSKYFITDSIVNGRRFRTFNLIDDCPREVLAIEIDTSLSSKRIIRILERVILERENQASLEQTMDQSSHQKNLSSGKKTMESKFSLFNLEDLYKMDTSNGSTESTENVSLMHIFSLNWIRSEN